MESKVSQKCKRDNHYSNINTVSKIFKVVIMLKHMGIKLICNNKLFSSFEFN